MNTLVTLEKTETESGESSVLKSAPSRRTMILLLFWTVNVALFLTCLVRFGMAHGSM